MKKSLLIIAGLVIAGFASTARDYDVVNENANAVDAIYKLEGNGDVSLLKGKTVAFAIDFDEAQIVEFDNDYRTVLRNFGSVDKFNKDHGEDYVRDWPGDLMNMSVNACKALKGALGANFEVVREGIEDEADYLMVVRVGLFEFGHFVAVAGAKSGGTITKGLVEIYDTDDNLVALYDINYLRGLNIGYGNSDRLRLWGKQFAKELKKAK